MKLLRLSFSNLNSLAGDFCIDFEHPQLADAGIFIIAGPTGSGKTTILDAVTYALYGETSRLGSFSQTRNELMSRSAQSCSAELLFEKVCEGRRRRFRVSTAQKRTRRASSATPYGPEQRRLTEILPGGAEVVLSEKSGDVDELVVEICGLSYDDFSRCIMLPQGKFQDFLRASAKERAESLMSITGTEIYAELGLHVRARMKELKDERARFRFLPVLSGEERSETERLLAEAAQQKRDGEAARAAVELELREQAAFEKLCADEAAARAHRDELRLAVERFRGSGDEARCEAALRARRVQPSDQRCAEAEARCRREGEAAAKLEALSPSLREKRRAAENVTNDCAARLRTESLRFDEREQRVRERLQPLEQDLQRQETLRQERLAQAQAPRRRLKVLQGEQDDLRQRIAQAEASRDEAERELQQLGDGSDWGEALVGWEISLRCWEDRMQGVALLPRELSSDEARHRTAALEHELGHLAGGESLAEANERLRRLRELVEAAQESASLANRLSELRRRGEALGSLGEAAQQEERKAAQRVRQAEQHAEAVGRLASVEEQLRRLAADFRAGRYTHCPCCGSSMPGEEPPPLPPDASETAQAWLREARREYEAAALKLRRAEQELAEARGEIAASEAQLPAREAKVAELLRQLGWAELPADPAALCRDLEVRVAAMQELERQRDELRRLLPALEAREDFSRRLAAHRNIVPRAEPPHEPAEARRLCEQARARLVAWEAAQRVQREQAEALAEARKLLSLKQTELMQTQRLLDGAEKALAEAQEACRALEQRRLDEWGAEGARGSEALLATWRDGLRSLERALSEAQKREAAARTDDEKTAALLKQQQERRAEAELACRKAEGELAEALAAVGFADEAAYRAALLPEARLEELLATRSELSDGLREAEQALQHWSAQLEPLRRQRAAVNADELREQRDQLDARLRELEPRLRELTGKLSYDDRQRDANRALEGELGELTERLRLWEELYEAMGGTADSFRDYAQGITMKMLVSLANSHLRRLHDRYLLLSDPEKPLELSIIDSYQDDKPRSCSNLSGGESFIVSLALALGLSHMVSDAQLDSLFLDEGFGTLDGETLEQVMESLQKLSASGRMVGVISHVEKLRERIPAAICVVPMRQGLSTLSGEAVVLARPPQG